MVATREETKEERALNAAYQNMPTVQDASKAITVQFVSDGISAFGHVWVAGQVLSVEKDSASYKTTLDSENVSWLEMDEEAQEARFGRRVHRPVTTPAVKRTAKKAPATPVPVPVPVPAPAGGLDFEDPDSPELASNPLLRKTK